MHMYDNYLIKSVAPTTGEDLLDLHEYLLLVQSQDVAPVRRSQQLA